MRALTVQEQNVFTNLNGYKVCCRVLVKDDTGVFRDFSNLDGLDWIAGADWDEDVDQPLAAASIRLVRDYAQGLSLAPLRTDSKFYGYVDIARELKIETACVPTGTTPQAGDWLLCFHGYIDSVDFAGDEVHLSCLDLGSRLQITFIEAERDYSNDTGVPVETVMQQILNDNGLSSITLYLPASTGSPGWNIKSFRQRKESVMDALTALAYQIGWDVRYRYDNVSSSFRLTFAPPPRSKTTVDYELSPEIYLDVTSLSVSRRDIRNAVQVSFLDRDPAHLTNSSEPKPTTTSATDAVSITKYGRQWMEIAEGASSQIDTLAEANRMRDAALADLKEPAALQDVELHLLPNIEVGDLLRFKANGVHYTQDQDLAVTKVQHSIDGSKTRTVVSVRGKPSGPRAQWFQMETRPGVAPPVRTTGPQAPTNVTASAVPGGVTVKFVPPLVGAWDSFDLHVSTTNGFTPSASTFQMQGSADRFTLTNLVPGTQYYARVIPKDAAGNVGTASAQLSFVAAYVRFGTELERAVNYGALPKNGDFEQWSDATKLPDSWIIHSGAFGSDIQVATAYTYSGRRALQLGGSVDSKVRSEVMAVKPGDRVFLDAVATHGGGGAPANALVMGVDWYSDLGLTLVSQSLTTHDLTGAYANHGMSQYTVQEPVIAPAGAKYCDVIIGKNAASAYTILIDSVRMLILPPVTPITIGMGVTGFSYATDFERHAAPGVRDLCVYKDSDGFVNFEGWWRTASGASFAIGTYTMFRLGAGWRPSQDVYAPLMDLTNYRVHNAIIRTTGDVDASFGVGIGATNFFTFTGTRFRPT